MTFISFKIRFLLTFCYCNLICTGMQAQDYARKIVDKLASKSYHGRGYVKKGDHKAAKFIAVEMKKKALETFNGSYFQSFEVPVYTYPSKMIVKFGNRALLPGIDFLIAPGSPGIKGSFQLVRITARELLSQQLPILKSSSVVMIELIDRKYFSKEEVAILDMQIDLLKYQPNQDIIAVIELTDEKLTWGLSTKSSLRTILYVANKVVSSEVSHVDLNIMGNYTDNYKTQNVIGYLPGESDSLIVLTAHYDHLGMMGSQAIFPGANDNASGVAMLLDLSDFHSKNERKYTMVFIAFGAEELGLLGSRYFIENPLIDLNKIKFLLNFDMAGTGDEGIQVVNGNIHRYQFDRLNGLNNKFSLMKQIKARGEACNSDHCFFHFYGVPSFFIYTLGGIQAYHDIYDRAETLPLTDFQDYKKLIIEFIKGF